MSQALFAVLPVFLIIFAGMILCFYEVMPESTGPILGVYVLKLALPLLMLHLLAAADIKDLTKWNFWAAIMGSMLIASCMGYWFDKLLCKRNAASNVIAALSCSACNAAFVGIPIITNLFPGNETALLIAGLNTLPLSVVVIFGQTRLNSLQKSQTPGKGSLPEKGKSFFKHFFLKNPMLMATFFGILLSASGMGIWQPLDYAVSLIGYTAAPCMLLSLGLGLRQKLAPVKKFSKEHTVRQCWFITCKLLLHPLICWGLLTAFGVQGLWLSVSVIMSATATALIVTVIAEVYKAVPDEAAFTAILSNGLSIVTITGFIWTLQKLAAI